MNQDLLMRRKIKIFKNSSNKELEPPNERDNQDYKNDYKE